MTSSGTMFPKLNTRRGLLLQKSEPSLWNRNQQLFSLNHYLTVPLQHLNLQIPPLVAQKLVFRASNNTMTCSWILVHSHQPHLKVLHVLSHQVSKKFHQSPGNWPKSLSLLSPLLFHAPWMVAPPLRPTQLHAVRHVVCLHMETACTTGYCAPPVTMHVLSPTKLRQNKRELPQKLPNLHHHPPPKNPG